MGLSTTLVLCITAELLTESIEVRERVLVWQWRYDNMRELRAEGCTQPPDEKCSAKIELGRRAQMAIGITGSR